jgi:uncharacterized protein YwgA
MDKRDWLLLAIRDEMQPIQIQKALFKFAQEAGAPKEQVYEFTPYNWGPCSFGIYDDLQVLRHEGLIETVPTGRGWSAYRTTEQGTRFVVALRQKADPALFKKIDEVREWVVTRSFEKLLKDVYSEYPAYATQSMFTKR